MASPGQKRPRSEGTSRAAANKPRPPRRAEPLTTGGDSLAGGEIIVIQDREAILAEADQIIAQVDVLIASDGLIRMEVNPERSSGQIVNNVPQTDVAQVTTNVMVPDGATLVIGGLMETVDDRRQGGQHLLSDLPLVGALFRERQQFSTKTELIVLLTPRIWDPKYGTVPRCLQPPYAVPTQTSTAPIHLGNPGP